MELLLNEGTPARIKMRRPLDMHHHLRRDFILQLVAPMVARRFAGAIVMPNTVPPITTSAMVAEYRKEIRAALGTTKFATLMTMYLTDTLDPEDVGTALFQRDIYGVKYYPRGLTTNSDSGVENPASLWTQGTRPNDVLRIIAQQGGVLFLHAADGFDANGNELDPYDQERHFIKETLPHIIDTHPTLKISVEHISTKQGAAFLEQNGGPRLGCSATSQHLLLDRRDVFRGGFRPHRSWWPIIQGQEHKEALRDFVGKGLPFVWLGTDSAPHPIEKKEADCCAGGVLMAHAGIELYVEAFEAMGALDRLEDFASFNGPRFLGFPPSNDTIELVREEWVVREPFFAGSADSACDVTKIVPFRLGEKVQWKLVA